ncbi:MAG TPA: NfeD family protein [Desulfomonilia bacterium]|nr:NfeD family protein [Desulfomonilia bacterium]
MAFEIAYWHWLIFGMALLIAEMFLGSMTILWFGLGALVIAALVFFVEDVELTWQLFIWALLSGWLTFLWFRYFKPFMADRTKAGISREAIVGETGHVISAPGGGRRGIIRFAKPLLGADEWPFICEQEVATGDRVVVKDVSGKYPAR